MSHIFVSYSHKDTEYAHRLAGKLQSEGFEVWIDARLDYGAQWPLEIQKQLDSCDAFILIMSPRSFTSEWVQSELSRAKRKAKPIFPLLLEGDETWLSVESTQYFDVRNESLPDAKFYDAIGRVISRGAQANQSRPADANQPPRVKPVPAPKMKTEIIVAIIGAVATICAAVISILWAGWSKTPATPQDQPTAASPATSIPDADNSITPQAVEVIPTLTSIPLPGTSYFQACPAACNGQNSTNNFAAGITKIYAQFNYENFKPGIPYTRTWTLAGREWIRYTCAWDGPESGVEILKFTEPKGLASGTWELKVTADHVVVLQQEIVIVGNGKYWDPAGTINACHGTN